jgi:L-rhamnonate dehydratase
LRQRLSGLTQVTTGEHESARWGFRQLIEMGRCDSIQPDVGWCCGLTELLRIADMADAAGTMVIPHRSSVSSYHFVTTRENTLFAEFLMMSPRADRIIPMFDPLRLGEPLPVNGRLKVPEAPGCGVTMNPANTYARPHACVGHAPNR